MKEVKEKPTICKKSEAILEKAESLSLKVAATTPRQSDNLMKRHEHCYFAPI